MNVIQSPLLSNEQQQFLDKLAKKFPDDGPGIPVFVEKNGDVLFVPEVRLPVAAQTAFEKGAPEGLWRGGAVVHVTWKGCHLVVPDERYQWFRSFGGVAEYAEGPQLIGTGIRELGEELFVFSLDMSQRFVPAGEVHRPLMWNSALNFMVDEVIEVGTLERMGFAKNELNRAYEAVLEWSLDEIAVPFSATYTEEFIDGKPSGVVIFVMENSRTLRGCFSGQQGFIEFCQMQVHPSLMKHL